VKEVKMLILIEQEEGTSTIDFVRLTFVLEEE